jgi:hypothetical protein
MSVLFYLVEDFLESQRPSENLSVEIQKGFKRLMGIISPQRLKRLVSCSPIQNYQIRKKKQITKTFLWPFS